MFTSELSAVQAGAIRAPIHASLQDDDERKVVPLISLEHAGVGRHDGPVVMIDKRMLERECLARGLRDHNSRLDIRTIGSRAEFRAHARELETPGAPPISAVLVVMSGRSTADQNFAEDSAWLAAEFTHVPVIVLADNDDPGEILAALECGAHGYVSTGVTIEVVAEAIALAQAGGIFVPASAVLALRDKIRAATNAARPLGGMFTTREAEVVEELRRGKANKIIAYELNLCESTVKVHIRNIMKKLRATNRTEVAYKLRDLTLQTHASAEDRPRLGTPVHG